MPTRPMLTRPILTPRGTRRRPCVGRGDCKQYDEADAFDIGAVVLSLTPREFALLQFLLRHRNEVVSKTQILEAVWDAHYEGDDNIVEVYIGYRRKKIDAPFGTRSIDTVRGVGYRPVGTGG